MNYESIFMLIKDIDVLHLIFLILPGFVSIKTFSIVISNESRPIKDLIFEAIFFGLVNFSCMLPVAMWIQKNSPDSFLLWWLFGTFYLLVTPVILALAFFELRRFFAKKGLVTYAERVPWDDFFLQKKHCWIRAHLKNGKTIGGKFYENSRASLHPDSGYLYIEELWHLNDDGGFEKRADRSLGVLLAPSEYLYIEILSAE